MKRCSIVIPAHNEESLIVRCLTSLLALSEKDEFEVIVVCNGCTDRTEDLARNFGRGVLVLNSEIASKTAALNLGDQYAHFFPRIYLDADVVLKAEDARALRDCLASEGEVLAAAPRLAVTLSKSPFFVSAFYRVWTKLPYISENLIGSGIIGLSESGRARFGEFPRVVSDDGFVLSLYSPGERRVLQNATFRIDAPRTLGGLIAIKTRARYGNLELERQHGIRISDDNHGKTRPLLALASNATNWADILVYVAIRMFCDLRARQMLRSSRRFRWARDESSRNDPEK